MTKEEPSKALFLFLLFADLYQIVVDYIPQKAYNQGTKTKGETTMKRKYTIRYRVYQNGPECVLTIDAANCFDAYDRAFYETVPALEGECPYSAWVESTTLKNGKTKRFNTCEGKPY